MSKGNKPETITLTIFGGDHGKKTFEVDQIEAYRGGQFFSVIILKDGSNWYVNESFEHIDGILDLLTPNKN